MEPILTPLPDYPEPELRALVNYAVSSEGINSALRAGDSSDPSVPLLDAAIARRRFARPCILLVGASVAGVSSYVSQEVFEYPAYLSTTDSAGSERRYYSREDPARLTIRIEAGTATAYLDDVPGAVQAEREYVLPRGTQFRVVTTRTVTEDADVRRITGDPFHPKGTTLLDVELALV